jgi:periplasmic protein CpxP/Spy
VNKRSILATALVLALGAMPLVEASTALAQDAAPSAQAPGNAPWENQAQAPSSTPAQQAAPAPQAAPQSGPDHRRGGPDQAGPGRRFGEDFAARAAARIAYIKTALKITPAQEAAFDKYAQAIRDNAQQMQQSFTQMRDQRGQAMNALDRVQQRAKFAQQRDQAEQRYLAAFRPLYESLSADQKKVADDLATPHFGRFGHFRHGGPDRGADHR